MMLVAVVLTPERVLASVDARARELGALIVVDGGSYIDASADRHRARLFLAVDRLWVLDDALRVLFEAPLQQIHALSVESTGAAWAFRVDWQEITSEFVYEGTFAEHLARVAEATVRSRLYRELPVLR